MHPRRLCMATTANTRNSLWPLMPHYLALALALVLSLALAPALALALALARSRFTHRLCSEDARFHESTSGNNYRECTQDVSAWRRQRTTETLCGRSCPMLSWDTLCEAPACILFPICSRPAHPHIKQTRVAGHAPSHHCCNIVCTRGLRFGSHQRRLRQ